MTEIQDSWREVASKAEALGLKLKLHLEQEREPDDEPERADTRQLLEDLGERVQEAVDSFGNAAKDPAVQEDVRDIGRLMKDALLTTFATVSSEVQDRTKGGGSEEE